MSEVIATIAEDLRNKLLACPCCGTKDIYIGPAHACGFHVRCAGCDQFMLYTPHLSHKYTCLLMHTRPTEVAGIE